jgi:hypothetical protein
VPYTDEQILETARDLVPHIGRLLGDDSPGFTEELFALLERAEAGDRVADRILELISGRDAVRAWAAERLDGAPSAAPPRTRGREHRSREPRAAPIVFGRSPPSPEPSATAPIVPSAPPPPPVFEPAPLAPEPVAGNGESGVEREDQRDPPRSAYGLLQCPDAVTVGVEFELLVGLAKSQQPGVAGGEFERPGSDVGPYDLAIDVAADGFDLRDDESWRNTLRVTYDNAYPTLALHLIASPQDEQSRQTKIEATFGIGGQVVGLAVRYLHVYADEAPTQKPTHDAHGVTMSIPSSETAPDLTITIRRWASESDGRLRWSVKSPHPVALPEDEERDIGNSPDAFARDLVRQMMIREAGGHRGMYAYLKGLGRVISRQIPSSVLETLRAVAEAVAPRTATCLLLSEEPYVPWELAVLDPPLAPSTPPFFGTQTVLGRWMLEDREPPPVSPPTAVEMRSMAVVSGVYSKPPWPRLLEAEGEASDLAQAYGARNVDATIDEVLACLHQGRPEADVLHFAVHGKYDPGGLQRGVALVDGQMLDPLQVESDPLTRPTFVFLNACQVGAGEQLLGDYAGMAASFLRAGAAAVIAPLWSINDVLAREIAKSFYEETLRQGGGPAEVIMRARRAIADPDEKSGTHLAYQFFGHPRMKLSR